METFSVLLALCDENASVTRGSPRKGQWLGAFIFLFDVLLNKRLNKQWSCWWFETWCSCDVALMGRKLDVLIWNGIVDTLIVLSSLKNFNAAITTISNPSNEINQKILLLHHAAKNLMRSYMQHHNENHSACGFRQWETKLHYNVVSHWLSPYPQFSLNMGYYIAWSSAVRCCAMSLIMIRNTSHNILSDSRGDPRSIAMHLSDYPDNNVLRANMGPIWGRQGPGGPHVGHMNLAIWITLHVITCVGNTQAL